MKRLLSAPLFIFLLTLTCYAQSECKRNVEPVGGFSFCAPDDWTVTEKEGEKYKIVFGARREGLTPNINIKDDANAALLADYTAASIKYILSHYQEVGATSMKVLTQDDFITTTGVHAVKVIYHAEVKGLIIRTIQYFFDGKAGQKLIVTCTALEADSGVLDPIFERALKTFRLDK
jgi:hypothetical protein